MNPEIVKANEESIEASFDANSGVLEDAEKQLENDPGNEKLKDIIEYTKSHLTQLLKELDNMTEFYKTIDEKDLGKKVLGAPGVPEPKIHRNIDSQGFVHSNREDAINADRTGNNQDPVEFPEKVG